MSYNSKTNWHKKLRFAFIMLVTSAENDPPAAEYSG